MNTNDCTPLVSIIVPMYGVEKYIERCATSLFAQTYSNIEFIFVDDGGTDNTVPILQGIIDKMAPAHTQIISKENKGLPAARKTGMDAAKGEYLLHIDSDDWIEPDTVEKLVKKALDTDADIVVYDFYKEYLHRRKLDIESESSISNPDLFRKRLYTYASYGYVWNKFCRKNLYDNVFVPKFAMHEDIVFSTQIIYKARKIVHLREGLYHYNRQNASATTRKPKKIRRGHSSRNLLDMYIHFKGISPSPVNGIEDEILLRTAWIGYAQDRSLFEEYPFLASEALAFPLKSGRFISILRQMILKPFLKKMVQKRSIY